MSLTPCATSFREVEEQHVQLERRAAFNFMSGAKRGADALAAMDDDAPTTIERTPLMSRILANNRGNVRGDDYERDKLEELASSLPPPGVSAKSVRQEAPVENPHLYLTVRDLKRLRAKLKHIRSYDRSKQSLSDISTSSASPDMQQQESSGTLAKPQKFRLEYQPRSQRALGSSARQVPSLTLPGRSFLQPDQTVDLHATIPLPTPKRSRAAPLSAADRKALEYAERMLFSD